MGEFSALALPEALLQLSQLVQNRIGGTRNFNGLVHRRDAWPIVSRERQVPLSATSIAWLDGAHPAAYSIQRQAWCTKPKYIRLSKSICALSARPILSNHLTMVNSCLPFRIA
jgi:hypothetical protein